MFRTTFLFVLTLGLAGASTARAAGMIGTGDALRSGPDGCQGHDALYLRQRQGRDVGLLRRLRHQLAPLVAAADAQGEGAFGLTDAATVRWTYKGDAPLHLDEGTQDPATRPATA